MFGQRSEEDVPPLVSGARRLVGQQPGLHRSRFMPILLEELGDQPPAARVGAGPSEVAGQVTNVIGW